MEIFEFDRPCGLVSSEHIIVRVMVPDGYGSGEKRYPVLLSLIHILCLTCIT